MEGDRSSRPIVQLKERFIEKSLHLALGGRGSVLKFRESSHLNFAIKIFCFQTSHLMFGIQPE